MILIYVAFGGALGAVLRYLLAGLVAFPMGTLMVNVAGSFLMGVAFAALLAGTVQPRFAAALMPGLLGGFTTFSAFSLDVVRLVEDGRIAFAGSYVALSVVASILACFAGLALARSVI
ncbi:fluoride efflux transporter FluC [Pseudaestuariivita atlantica]|uniref:Fluoride-specific ion channel FluC n=1 Tax=Pseudaestuariivita atlantica TaxID=1317121 RepID=A0A0L1JKN6_9RHOB|nr:CrcB family protein [Pseudaestuariivita atlantica]KNG92287.1 hypothetical protein ATO11_18180 [Pseudaestuariivita atlantica]